MLMRFHEEFSRCTCGNPHLKKEVFTLAHFESDPAGRVINFNELPEKSEIHYTCIKCGTLIHTKRE